MKRIILACLAAGLGLILPDAGWSAPNAASIRFSTSPVPVGSGARALGMGGAFVAVADDATAASWNPGGLFQLERPEFSVAYSLTSRSESYSSGTVSDFNVDAEANNNSFNYFSAVYPFQAWRRNMIVSLNYQRLYEMDRNLSFDINTDFTVGTETVTANTQFEVLRRGSLKTLSPAFALQISPTLALGMTANIWSGLGSSAENGWREKTNIHLVGVTGSGAAIDQRTFDENLYENFTGFNFNVGFLWDPHPIFTLGGVIKTPFTAKIDHQYLQITAFQGESGGEVASTPKGANESLSVEWPWSAALGGAARLSDELTFSLDATYTDWNDFLMETCSGEGEARTCGKTNPITGKPADEADLQATLQIRMGMEYLIILKKTVVPVRAGLFYDPEPAPGSPEEIYGLSLGTGVSWENYLSTGFDMIFDVAWQARMGQDLNGGLSGIPGSKMDLFQNTILLSMIHHF